jgi:hypothetical protein
MARKTYVELIDDINGDKAEETVSFALDGVAYEIDLTAENAEKLREERLGRQGAPRRGSPHPRHRLRLPCELERLLAHPRVGA